MQTSGGGSWRLKFLVEYTLSFDPQRWISETILSSPFIVNSNTGIYKAVTSKLKLAMKPVEGNSKEVTEVWIRGDKFCEGGMYRRMNYDLFFELKIAFGLEAIRRKL